MTTAQDRPGNGELRRSPLHSCHLRLGAKFAEFGGWLMPLDYSVPVLRGGAGNSQVTRGPEAGGVLAEHTAVREKLGIFDVSHLGTIEVTGPGAADYLNTVLAGDLAAISAGKAQYQLLCNERGGVVDDLIACRRSGEDILLVPNAANCATVASILADGAPESVEVRNAHGQFAIIAVQGPRSDELLSALGNPVDDLGYMSFTGATLGGTALTLCRSGYTGERGVELVMPAERAEAVWRALLETGEQFGARPCGLAARDTLRTEMGYPLHGQDISAEIDPVSAGLSWAVGWDKAHFRGDQALRKIRIDKSARRLRGLKATGRGIPRPGMDCVVAGGDATSTTVGQVTSGTFGPTLRTGIGLALLDPSVTPGQHVGVVVRRRVEDFEVVRPPFVPSRVR